MQSWTVRQSSYETKDALAGLMAVAFGPPYTYMLLRLVYGQRWSETEAPRALAVYCLYILLMAVNGILEAFVHAVANSRCACIAFVGSHLPLLIYGLHLICTKGDCVRTQARASCSNLGLACSPWF